MIEGVENGNNGFTEVEQEMENGNNGFTEVEQEMENGNNGWMMKRRITRLKNLGYYN